MEATSMTPAGCRLCGVPEREHYTRYDEHGEHGYQTPTDRQRLQRMLNRARARSRARVSKK